MVVSRKVGMDAAGPTWEPPANETSATWHMHIRTLRIDLLSRNICWTKGSTRLKSVN